MPLLPLLVLSVLGGTLVAMFVFILGRRAWRALTFRRLDRLREYWLRRLPFLLAGEIPTAQEMRAPEAREALESLLVNRFQTAASEDQQPLTDLIERSGLLDYRIRLLRRGSRWERLHSASLLGQIRARAAIPALVEALEERWPPLRVAALRSLGMIGCSAAGPAILRSLRQGVPLDPSIWLEAAVACVDDPEVFLPLLQDDREAVRALAARAIAESPRVAAFEVLNPFAFHPDPEVRAQVLRTLGRSRDNRVVPLLIAATQDDVWFVRLRAIGALGEVGAHSALDAVLRATGDSHFRVRQRAAATLASLAARPGEILETLRDTNDRYAVEAYLSQLARAGLLWRSLALLRAPQEAVRRDAGKLLSGAVAAGFHQAVVNGVEMHPDWRVRMAAARLLAQAQSPALEAELEQRLATAPTARSRRLLRAILRSRLSVSGDITHGLVARPA